LAIQDRADQYGIGSIYRNGGTQNVKVEISGNNVSLSPLDPMKSMLVFLNNRFEVIEPEAFSRSADASGKVFLNSFSNRPAPGRDS
jgi:hypothetical protein